jgi:hypothetical protein
VSNADRELRESTEAGTVDVLAANSSTLLTDRRDAFSGYLPAGDALWNANAVVGVASQQYPTARHFATKTIESAHKDAHI